MCWIISPAQRQHARRTASRKRNNRAAPCDEFYPSVLHCLTGGTTLALGQVVETRSVECATQRHLHGPIFPTCGQDGIDLQVLAANGGIECGYRAGLAQGAIFSQCTKIDANGTGWAILRGLKKSTPDAHQLSSKRGRLRRAREPADRTPVQSLVFRHLARPGAPTDLPSALSALLPSLHPKRAANRPTGRQRVLETKITRWPSAWCFLNCCSTFAKIAQSKVQSV